MESPNSGRTATRLLVVDDEPAQLKALCETLADQGYVTHGFASAASALEHLRIQPCEVLLTDLMMPGMDGITLLDGARNLVPDIACIVMTGHGTVDTAVQALKGGAVDYVLKPFRLSTILRVVERALEIARLRELVERRTLELEQSNKDLEAFSYSVSHDLRAPLRTVIGYSNVLMEDFSDSVPDAARQILAMINTNGLRMSQLIEDLLTFARYGSQKIVRCRFSMHDLVRSVVTRLMHDEQTIDLQIGELPPCTADPSLLEQVITNLVSNAIKFSRGVAAPKIEIGAREEAGGGTVYFVRDNGAGFDMRYADKLFGVFQRLHSQVDFEGTGVGLSIVHRIIVRHGGRVWAESEPARGATFFFSLPRAAPDASE